jgi:carbamoyl-phosphate synthase large subunit
MSLPTSGGVFMSFRDADKHEAPPIARELHALGFTIHATHGTAKVIAAAGGPVTPTWKVREGRPDIVDLIKNGKIQLLINTPLGKKAQYDEAAMRLAGLRYHIDIALGIAALEGGVDQFAALHTLDEHGIGQLRVG